MISISNLENVENSICKILNNSKSNNNQNGFFLKIKDNLKLTHFLISIYSPFSILNKEKIEFIINNGEKFIININEKERLIHFFKDQNIAGIAIEILDEDEIKNKVNFLSVDLNCLDGYMKYKDQNIFTLQYSENNKINCINGKIVDIYDDSYFSHSLKLENSIGSPIILKGNSKVIGFNNIIEENKKNNGIFIFKFQKLFSFLLKEVKLEVKIQNFDKLMKSKGLIKINDFYILGYFIELRKNLKVFLTSSSSISQDDINSKNQITIQLYNGQEVLIQLDTNERIIKVLYEYKIIVIEIIDDDKIKDKIEFLLCDIKNNAYESQNILIMKNDMKDFFKYTFLVDKIKKIVNNDLFLYDETLYGYFILPIININNFKVLGLVYIGKKKLINAIIEPLINPNAKIYIPPRISFKNILNISKSICKIKYYAEDLDLDDDWSNGCFIKIEQEKTSFFLVVLFEECFSFYEKIEIITEKKKAILLK